MRRLVLTALVAALAGCGGSSHGTATARRAPAGPASALPGAHNLYDGGGWGVVVAHGRAFAVHRVAGHWRVDSSGRGRIAILGPPPGAVAPARPQIAAELIAPARLVESGLWLDGRELAVKGGGLSPRRGTIYGAPDATVARGVHTAIAYARTASTATAV